MASKDYPISARVAKPLKDAYDGLVDDVNKARRDAGLEEINASEVLRRIVRHSIERPPTYLRTEE